MNRKENHMIAWGKAFIDAMAGFSSAKETGLTRMFRTEYGKEYYMMKKNGYEINDTFVKQFLSDRKNS
jgi:hypothetical protein